MSTPDVRVFSDRERMSRAVARALVGSARSKDRFTLALAGGSTPHRVYELLATELRGALPWSRVHFFWSDERYVSKDHPDSNYRMAREALFDKVDVPDANLHVPPVELDEPEEAARRYEGEIRDLLGPGPSGLDAVLLGLGEDGHIASLFPQASTLEEQQRWVVVVRQSPKPPPVRLTFTLPLINGAAQVHLIVAGSAKAGAVQATLEGPRDPRRFPAQGVKPARGTLTWWLDEAAAAKLERLK